jgi:hypothetical protein
MNEGEPRRGGALPRSRTTPDPPGKASDRIRVCWFFRDRTAPRHSRCSSASHSQLEPLVIGERQGGVPPTMLMTGTIAALASSSSIAPPIASAATPPNAVKPCRSDRMSGPSLIHFEIDRRCTDQPWVAFALRSGRALGGARPGPPPFPRSKRGRLRPDASRRHKGA